MQRQNMRGNSNMNQMQQQQQKRQMQRSKQKQRIQKTVQLKLAGILLSDTFYELLKTN